MMSYLEYICLIANPSIRGCIDQLREIHGIGRGSSEFGFLRRGPFHVNRFCPEKFACFLRMLHKFKCTSDYRRFFMEVYNINLDQTAPRGAV